MTTRDAGSVDIELIALRVEAALAYRLVRSATCPGEHPDDAALRLTGSDRTHVQALHSTSWRWERGRVMLTYAVVPDPRHDLPAQPLPSLGVAISDDPARPTPHGLHDHHVLAHAIRHLADLHTSDPIVRATADDAPVTWAAICTAATDMPVDTREGARRPVPRRQPDPTGNVRGHIGSRGRPAARTSTVSTANATD